MGIQCLGCGRLDADPASMSVWTTGRPLVHVSRSGCECGLGTRDRRSDTVGLHRHIVQGDLAGVHDLVVVGEGVSDGGETASDADVVTDTVATALPGTVTPTAAELT